MDRAAPKPVSRAAPTHYSRPMLLGTGQQVPRSAIAEGGSATGLYVALGAIVALEINALFGGMAL